MAKKAVRMPELVRGRPGKVLSKRRGIHTQAFDSGQLPVIACVNAASADLGVDFAALVAAMQAYVDHYFAPVWGWPCRLAAAPGRAIPAGQWALVFTDNADVAGALGYHDLTPDGFPLSHVFVQTTRQAGEEVSVTASHELVEMLADPNAADGTFNDREGVWYAKEVADAVETSRFPVNGINMSSFVFPAWFESFRLRTGTAGRYDILGECRRPFEIRKGGYMPVWSPRSGWTQIFGSKAAERRFELLHAHKKSRGGLRGRALRKSRRLAA